jgi:GTP:adenosylcobinamide-phosphate guanylyltransferase
MSTPILDAVILAGGDTPPELAGLGPTERALIEFGGQSLIGHMVSTLRATRGVGRIIVVSGAATHAAARALDENIVEVAARELLSQNVLAGLHAASTPRALVVTCDIPLTSAATFEELLNDFHQRKLESAYPIVRRETMEAAFPGGRRTYAKCREGVFTGGNAFVLPTTDLDRLGELIERAFASRKNPLAVAKLLGFRILARAIAGTVSLAELERKFSSLLGCRCGGVVMNDAAIAFDVDKLSDLEVAQQKISSAVTGEKPL